MALTSDNKLLINNLYPVDYFSLPNVEPIPSPDSGQWISQSRFSSVNADRTQFLPTTKGGSATKEFLEIDLGFVRTVNYATFDIQMAPIIVTLEYDVISSSGQPHSWVEVTPMVDQPFDSRIQYDPQSQHGWFHAQMYFVDSKGNPVQSRYLRLTFQRRNNTTLDPTPWPISVQNFRAGLFSLPSPPVSSSGSPSGIVEATGLLFFQEPIGLIPFLPDIDDSIPGGITGTQVRQRFVIPDAMVRIDSNQNPSPDGSKPATNIEQTVPDILGFGVFINVPVPFNIGDIDENYLKNRVKFGWSLWDATDPTNMVQLRHGIEQGAASFGDQWIDVYFDNSTSEKPPPPPIRKEQHCGVWTYYICANDPENILHWFWHDLTTQTAYTVPPPGAPELPLAKLGGVIGPINEHQPFFPCGLAKGEGSWIPQEYCYTVQQPPNIPQPSAPPPNQVAPEGQGSGTIYCGEWKAWKLADDHDLAVVLNAYWHDNGGSNSLHAPPGAPPPPPGYKLQLPPTVAYVDAPIVVIPPDSRYDEPFCYTIPEDGPPPPPQPPPKFLNNKVYELRVWSLDVTVADQFYISEPNNLSDRALAGTMTFTEGSTIVTTTEDVTDRVNPGDWIMASGVFDTVETGDTPLAYEIDSITSSQITLIDPYGGTTITTQGLLVYALYGWDGSAYIPDGEQNLAMRLWGNTGASGQDVLGNSYRYATKEKAAKNVDINSQAGWISAAMPTQNAVEALYFDVRDLDSDGHNIYRVIDSLTIAPLTPGVQMSIYFSQSNLQGDPPKTVDDWDYLLWSPVSHNTFTLTKKQRIVFPFQIRASYMKLEFTALQPLPWKIPTFPPLPPQIYRRYPTWIEQQFENSQVRQLVQDWWLRNSTPVEINILNTLRDPVREFEYEEGLMYAVLALSTPPLDVRPTPIIAPVNATIQQNTAAPVLDATTGQKIWLEGPPNRFATSMLRSVDQMTLLGQTVVSRFDSTAIGQTEKLAQPVPASTSSVKSVSTAGPRISNAFSFLANTPMRFNTTCRHVYKQEWGEFNKKAFFVGINMVQFSRTDFTVKHDDIVIRDILHDDLLLEENSWMRSTSTRIEDGGTVWVSYRVNETDYVDEELILYGDFPVPLEGKGPNLHNVLVFSLHEKFGVEYFENDDYEIVLGVDMDQSSPTFGQRTYAIARSSLAARLEVPPHPLITQDAETIVSYGFLGPANTWDDAATIVSTGQPMTFFERLAADTPGFGTATFGAGNFGEL